MLAFWVVAKVFIFGIFGFFAKSRIFPDFGIFPDFEISRRAGKELFRKHANLEHFAKNSQKYQFWVL